MQQPTLSLPRDAMRPAYDVVVVGSGYGGGVTACRLVPSSGSAFWNAAGRCRSDRFRRAYRSFAASFR